MVALAAIVGLSLGAAYSQNASATAVETYKVQRSILEQVMVQKWINEQVKNNAEIGLYQGKWEKMKFIDCIVELDVPIEENGRFPYLPLENPFISDEKIAFYQAFYKTCFVNENGGPTPRSAADVADFRAKKYGYKKEYWATVDAVVLALTAQERNWAGELITFKNVNFGDSPVRITGRDPYRFDTRVKSVIAASTKAAIKKRVAEIELEKEKLRQAEEKERAEKEKVAWAETKWAETNVDDYQTFAERPDMYTKFYQWNRSTAWADTGAVSGWNFRSDESETWTVNPCPAGWRLPTVEEFEALGSSTWAVANARGNAVAGRFFGPNRATCSLPDNMSGCIFLPASGSRDGSSLDYQGTRGHYWSATQYNRICGYVLDFNSTNVELLGDGFGYKRGGMSIRCVQNVE